MASHKGAPTAAEASGSVLLVANYAPDVGFAWWLMEHFWVQLAVISREFGLHPILAYPKAGQLPTSIKEARIETVTLPFPGSSLSDMIRALRFVRARRVRYIYFTDRQFSSVAYALFRLAGTRLILNHDHSPGDRPPVAGAKGFAKFLVRRAPLINCDMQMCVSPLIADRARLNARIPDDRIVVVQNGIGPSAPTADRHYAHQEFGLPPDAQICVVVGRAHRYKRIDFAVKVAAQCQQKHSLAHLFFLYCGDGPDLDRLKAMVNRYGVSDHFIFAGRREDVPELLASADFALHPAQGEAFSLAILEYMRASLVVLVPDIPSVSQAITHGDTGLIYPDGDVDSAARMLLTLTRDATQRGRLGRAAAQRVREAYSFSAMEDQFQHVARATLSSLQR